MGGSLRGWGLVWAGWTALAASDAGDEAEMIVGLPPCGNYSRLRIYDNFRQRQRRSPEAYPPANSWLRRIISRSW